MLGLGKVFFEIPQFNREIGFLIPEVIFWVRIEDHFLVIFRSKLQKNLKCPKLSYDIDGTSVHTYLRYGFETSFKVVYLLWVYTQVLGFGFLHSRLPSILSGKMDF